MHELGTLSHGTTRLPHNASVAVTAMAAGQVAICEWLAAT